MALNSKYTKTVGLTVKISNATADALPLVDPNAYVDLSTTIKKVGQQGGQSTEIDVTTFASTAKENAAGLADYGTWALSGNWVSNDTGQQAMYTAQDSADPYAFEITYPDGTTIETIAFVTQISVDSEVNGVASGSFNLRISGKPTITPGT